MADDYDTNPDHQFDRQTWYALCEWDRAKPKHMPRMSFLERMEEYKRLKHESGGQCPP